MPNRYVGLISGTSADGVDAVVADLSGSECRLLAAATHPYPPDLHRRVTTLIETPETSLEALGRLDSALGAFFAQCALEAVSAAGLKPDDIAAIGHHGQTVFHAPTPPDAFTLQLGDPNVVAARTGITTVADFRRLDMAYGGQGAPLVCGFHAWTFSHPTETRAVVNIGGIGNITLLAPGIPPIGFDTGPGNTLLDHWIHRHQGKGYDRDGEWSAAGNVDRQLLERLLDDPYFTAAPPKSTGREKFNADWLNTGLATHGRTAEPRDVQATLAELTAQTIRSSIRRIAPDCSRLIVCGGGAHNSDLMARLRKLSNLPVEDSGAYGISPDWVEGAAFAWLAHARLNGLPGNLPSVTGAERAAVLGGVYSGAVAATPSIHPIRNGHAEPQTP